MKKISLPVIALTLMISGCDWFDSDKLKYLEQISQMKRDYDARIQSIQKQYASELQRAHTEINSLKIKLRDATAELEKAKAEIKRTQSLHQQMFD